MSIKKWLILFVAVFVLRLVKLPYLELLAIVLPIVAYHASGIKVAIFAFLNVFVFSMVVFPVWSIGSMGYNFLNALIYGMVTFIVITKIFQRKDTGWLAVAATCLVIVLYDLLSVFLGALSGVPVLLYIEGQVVFTALKLLVTVPISVIVFILLPRFLDKRLSYAMRFLPNLWRRN